MHTTNIAIDKARLHAYCPMRDRHQIVSIFVAIVMLEHFFHNLRFHALDEHKGKIQNLDRFPTNL